MSVKTGENTFSLSQGDFFAVPCSKRHVVAVEADHSEFINVLFRGTLFTNLHLRVIPLYHDELKLFDALVEHAYIPFNVIRAELAVAELISILCKLSLRLPECMSLENIKTSNEKQYISNIVLNTLDYLEEHFSERITLEQTANHIGISASHLRHLLLKKTGFGFSSHLLQIRIAHAKKMIESSPGDIKSIAEDCGFNSLTFFYKVFKRLTNMTPAEYGRSVS